MTEQELIKFKELSMQDGRLNLQWFAEYVAQAEREECAKLCDQPGTVEQWDGLSEAADRIRARGKL